MKRYTVKKLSDLSGVSIRTLHHYDKIGLLKPEFRDENNYRYYGKDELFKLQQILIYKELDLPLKDISKILDDKEFDLKESLINHKKRLEAKQLRLSSLIKTIEKTIKNLKNKNDMIDENELYAGFKESEKKAYRKEAIDKYGQSTIEKTEMKLKQMTKQQFEDLQKLGDEINYKLANLLDLDPSDKIVQDVIEEHAQYIAHFHDFSLLYYEGLANLYISDDRFKTYYEKYKKGLAKFLSKAMIIYCKNKK